MNKKLEPYELWYLYHYKSILKRFHWTKDFGRVAIYTSFFVLSGYLYGLFGILLEYFERASLIRTSALERIIILFVLACGISQLIHYFLYIKNGTYKKILENEQYKIGIPTTILFVVIDYGVFIWFAWSLSIIYG